MARARGSLFYLAGYLWVGGVGFLSFPQTMLKIFLSNGQYSDVMVRLVGVLLVALGIVVVQIIRHRVTQLYPTTLVARAAILVGLIALFAAYRDPLMLVLVGIVGLGFVLTFTALAIDRRRARAGAAPESR